MRRALALTLAFCTTMFAYLAARGEQTTETAMLGQEISAKVPSTWQIHVSWREEADRGGAYGRRQVSRSHAPNLPPRWKPGHLIAPSPALATKEPRARPGRPQPKRRTRSCSRGAERKTRLRSY